MTQYNTRALVESALLAVIGIVLVLLGQYVPFIGAVASLLWPLPCALAVLRHGMRWGVMASVLTALCLSLFIDWMTALSLWILFGLTGLTFGYAVLKRYSPAKIIVVTSVAFLASILSGFLLAYILTGSPLRYLDDLLMIFQSSAEMTEKIVGVNPYGDIFTNFDELRAQVIRILPYALTFAALLQSYINFEVLRRVLDRLGHHLEPLPPFTRWLLPEYIAHGAVISYLGFWAGVSYKLPALEVVCQNVFAGFSFLLFLETASVVAYYLAERNLPKWLTAVIMFYAFSNPFLNLLSISFGMIDILFDFRKLRYADLGGM